MNETVSAEDPAREIEIENREVRRRGRAARRDGPVRTMAARSRTRELSSAAESPDRGERACPQGWLARAGRPGQRKRVGGMRMMVSTRRPTMGQNLIGGRCSHVPGQVSSTATKVPACGPARILTTACIHGTGYVTPCPICPSGGPEFGC
jgi:hypothetical protein